MVYYRGSVKRVLQYFAFLLGLIYFGSSALPGNSPVNKSFGL